MLRTFAYKFDPAACCPIKGKTAELSVQEIENAGLLEVLQTPGASLGSWAFLDALLDQTGPGTPFTFKEPLGQAREVKVALSGLFGRFVARAYLERYFDLSVFAHLGLRNFRLDGRQRISIKRKRGRRGDLPDWLATDASLSKLFIAEAKGCHDKSGADQALGRAWAQADRIDVISGGRKAPVKRIAIATRWGVASGGPNVPIMAVRDPDETGDMRRDEMDAALIGIARLHTADLLKGVGYKGLADKFRELNLSQTGSLFHDAQQQALALLEAADVHAPTEVQAAGPTDPLVGGWVTPAGLANDRHLSASDRQVLERLDLRPVFVGVERRLLRGLVTGDLELIRSSARARVPAGTARTNGAGVWMLRPTGQDATG